MAVSPRHPRVPRANSRYLRPRLEAPEGRAVPAGGALDPTFGAGGKVQFNLIYGDVGNDLARQPDGKYIVAGGGDGLGNSSDVGLARLNPDGSLDPSFG